MACTPDSCTSTHVAAASGSSSHQDRTRRWTSSANSASGTSASASGSTVRRVGVEDRDDGDGEQVVDDGEGEQERAQGGGQVGADHRQHGEREGDVGGGRDRPAGQRAVRPPRR